MKEELFLDFDIAHTIDVATFLDSYIDFFNHPRRLASTVSYRSPVQYKTELGLC